MQRKSLADRRSAWPVLATAVVLLASCSTEPADTDKREAPGIQTTSGVEDVHDIRPLGSHTVNGAIWNTAQNFSVGTGVLEPFLRVQGSSNDFDDIAGTEEGFNTDFRPNVYDQDNSPHHHSLALNHVPVVSIGGTFYREFIFDANEANSDPDANFSIDLFDLWMCKEGATPGTEDPDLFDEYEDFDQTGTNTNCKRVYSIDDNAGGPGGFDGDWIQASDANSKGSGSAFDYQILIPEDNFLAAAAAIAGFDISDCAYAGPTADSCGAWLLLKVKLGGQGGQWVVGSTFEEVSTLNRPFVSVVKTAVPTFTRIYNWVIQKSVNPTSIILFEGQNQNATWTINVTPGTPPFVDQDAVVNGEITICAGIWDPAEETCDDGPGNVTINSVTDVIPGYPGITPSCGVTFPHVLTNENTLVCTYSAIAPDTDPGSHTNTATVSVEAALDEDDVVDASIFQATADFDFGDVTPTEIDKDPPVYDNYNGEGEVLLGDASDQPFSYIKNYECDDDEGSYSNTARVDLTAPRTDPTASANLTVDCLDVTVAKTTNESLTRTYLWLIDKSVTPANWELFRGDQGTSAYTVTVTPNGFQDNVHVVSGVITITGDPNASVYIQQHVTDTVKAGNFTPAVTDCEDNGVDVTTPLVVPYELEAGHVLTCDYSQALPDGTNRTNNAYVVAKPTPAGTNKTFTGSTAVDFTGATLSEVDKTVHVDDTYAGGPQDALVTDLTNPTVFNYNRTFTCDADAGTHENTATIVETAQSDDASVTVVCRVVNISKNATTSFDRDFNWDIDKQVDNSGPLIMMPGQSFILNYTILVTKSAAIDSDWHVTGLITITHTHTTQGALLNSLSDVVSGVGGGNATISGCNVGGNPFSFPGTLAVGATLTCTYDLDLPDATSRTNTATTVLQNHSYASNGTPTATGTTNWATSPVNVTFGAPTNVTDNCALVDDTFSGGPQDDPICASKTYNYSRTVLAPEASCTDFTVDNTATVTPDDDPPEQDGISVPVDVQCPTGCTLTLGYWKTHNETFPGGAPVDETWDLLGALAEATGFFTTVSSYPTTGPNSFPSFSWYNVFWTSPSGNAYYQLAHQYMAAKLNILNGADPTAVATAIATAEALFGDPAPAYTPAQIGALKGNDPLRKQFLSLAGTLADYNEGDIGPGHCSEDQTSLLTLR